MPQAKRSKARNIGDPPPKQFSMDFFAGATADSNGGVGVCIWISEQHFIEMKLGCGVALIQEPSFWHSGIYFPLPKILDFRIYISLVTPL